MDLHKSVKKLYDEAIEDDLSSRKIIGIPEARSSYQQEQPSPQYKFSQQPLLPPPSDREYKKPINEALNDWRQKKKRLGPAH